MKHSSDSERGQAIVILALMMIVLLAFAALAVDGGNAYVERRRSQNAADAAALAGARQIWKQQVDQNSSETDLLNIINQAAESNGISAGEPSNNPNVVAYYTTNFEGTTINPNQIGTLGIIPPNVTGIRVQASRQFNTFIGGIIKQSPAASAQATAVIIQPLPCGGSWAIFANASQSCPPAHTSISGGGQGIKITNGGVYSHGDLECDTSKATVVKPNVWEYHGSLKNAQCASNPDNIVQTGIEPAPPAWTYEDFLPGGPVATALGSNYHIIPQDAKNFEIPADGLYYMDGSFDPNFSIAPTVRKVTIVASGEIQFSGGIDLTAYYSGLLLFSNLNSDNKGIGITGSSLNWKGLIYAPHAQVKMSASANGSIAGSINAACVDLSGAEININYDPASCVPQRARVVLLK